MSQEQTHRPEQEQHKDPVKYGDVFNVYGELAEKPIAPQDAAMMQAAEARVFGQTQKGGPAAAMQAAATLNEGAGLVGHDDVTGVTGDKGVTVAAINYPGTRVITESVAGQVVGQYYVPVPVQQGVSAPVQSQVTIGEALEVTARTAGDKPVDQSDASAIQAAEARATGSSVMAPGGIAASAQSAASHNANMDQNEDKIKIRDVLSGARLKMVADKAATKEDAEGVVSAELRNNPARANHPGGVGASITAAARLNEGST